MIIVLTGAPGAGKGTQADMLVKNVQALENFLQATLLEDKFHLVQILVCLPKSIWITGIWFLTRYC